MWNWLKKLFHPPEPVPPKEERPMLTFEFSGEELNSYRLYITAPGMHVMQLSQEQIENFVAGILTVSSDHTYPSLQDISNAMRQGDPQQQQVGELLFRLLEARRKKNLSPIVKATEVFGRVFHD